MKGDTVLSLQGLGKMYPGNNRGNDISALLRLDLEVRRGEFLAVVGESGCGKSTLINLIAGFIKPTFGTALVNNREITGPGPDRIVVFQDHAVFPWYTALDNVAYGLRRQGMGKIQARAEAQKVLENIGLGEFAHSYPATLSGGMRQRVALARSLVLRPEVLLLDEPFAALDMMTRERLQDELLRMWGEYGCTIVFVTHGLQEALYLADRVLVLQKNGRAILEYNTLPRPRERQDKSIAELSVRLSGCLGDTVGRNEKL